MNLKDYPENAIAVIGMACRYPSANDIFQYWNLIKNGKEAITFFDHEILSSAHVPESILNDKNYVKARGIIDNVEYFDAAFFNYSPAEAKTMDPQQRIFLQLAYQALENSGYVNSPLDVGVYAGMHDSTYFYNNILKNSDILNSTETIQYHIATSPSFLSTKVSYKLNLTGPSLSINTACSTSLVAIITAVKDLIQYECDMAIAGGISIDVPQLQGYMFSQGSILSPDGHCRPFSVGANGTVPSNGAGAVVLRRLEDAIKNRDKIDAVIIGYAVNNDGKNKVGYTAPGVEGQAKCIYEAMAINDILPETISYLEAHATGTIMGDPIEVEALKSVYQSQTAKKQFCAIGSVKANIGHTNTAAGSAGFIKSVLALKNKMIPPSINCQELNPKIDFKNSPFYVPAKPVTWNLDQYKFRRAGISAFGIGGTNAHIILQEAPDIPKGVLSRRRYHFMPISNKTGDSLKKTQNELLGFLNGMSSENLNDMEYTLVTKRPHYDCRDAVIINHNKEVYSLSGRQRNPEIGGKDVVFLFSGQGTQYINMARGIYERYPYFRELMDTCFDIADEHLDEKLKAIIFPSGIEMDYICSSKLRQTKFTQPALFIIEYCLARLLMHWGITPAAMAGHSLGEYAAACLSGIFTLDDAIKLVIARADAMQKTLKGTMLAVSLPADEIRLILPDDIDIAAINAGRLTVVSGTEKSIVSFKQFLQHGFKNVHLKELKTSHAFHSSLIEPAIEVYKKDLETINISLPEIPVISNITGKFIDNECLQPDYWLFQMRKPVLFSEGINTLFKNGYSNFIEIGPGETLSTLVKQHDNNVSCITTLPHPQSYNIDKGNDEEYLIKAAGSLWKNGFNINLDNFYSGENLNVVDLPPYVFSEKMYWIDDEGNNSGAQTVDVIDKEKSDVALSLDNNSAHLMIESIFKETLDLETVDFEEDFFTLGGHSLLLVNLIEKINKTFDLELPIAWGFENRTIREQSLAVRTMQKERKFFLQYNSKGTKLPMFMLHPWIGGAEVYYKLADRLGKDQPIYAFEPYNLYSKKKLLTTIEALAFVYLQTIKEIQPEGPYILCGWSSGGVLAYEIAQQLLRQNEKIKSLYLIDTSLDSSSEKTENEVLHEIRNIFEKENHYDRLPVNYRERLEMTALSDYYMIERYAAKSYSGKIILFKATQLMPEHKVMRKFNGLEKFIQNMDVIFLEADHSNIVSKEKSLSAIAEYITKDLEM